MSAIAGVFRRDGHPADRRVVAGMIGALGHRAPGSPAVWASGRVGLAQLDSSSGSTIRACSSPVTDELSGLVVIGDARLDNRDELRPALSLGAGDACTDLQLLLRAYQRWGAAAPTRLVGDFAFAIWEARTGTLFCGRDPMGVRPFYYHLSDRQFVFGSEVKALFASPEVARVIDDRAVALHLAGIQEDREATLFAGIRRLPAAHTLTVTPERTVLTRFWAAEDSADVRFGSDESYAAAFREIFTEAVRVRANDSRPVGAALSGGLDSSSVVCVARALTASQGRPLHTFSLIFPELPAVDRRLIDERPYIDSVTRLGGLVPHMVRGDMLSPMDDLDRVLWHLDEPFIAPNLYLHWGMFAAAHAAGVRVFLDGFDGDTTVSHGFGRLNGMMRRGEWTALEAEVRSFAQRRGTAPEAVLQHFALPYVSDLARRGAWRAWMQAARELTRRFQLSRRETVVDHGLAPLLPDFVDRSWRAVTGRRDDEVELLRPPLASHVATHVKRRARDQARKAAGSERESHVAALSQPIYQLTLEMADKSGRAFGVEPRYPFFDRRLIEFCVGVPEEQRFVDGWPRSVFRRAMQGLLPDEIRQRSTKGNLAPNFDRKLRATGRARRQVGAGTPALSRYVDDKALERIERRFAAADLGWRDPAGPLLFRTSVFGHWLAMGEPRQSAETRTSARVPALV